MAGYTLQRLENEPIIILTFHKTFDMSRDFVVSTEELTGVLEAAGEPVFLVVDATDAPALNVQDVMVSASHLTRSKTPLLHHRYMREMVYVSQNKAFALAAKGLSAPIFGG